MPVQFAFVFLLSISLPIPVFAVDNHHVRGHAKKNGTYVAPHRQINHKHTQREPIVLLG